MERRQALVVILVALVVSGVSRPPDSSASLDPFDLFLDSDYSDSRELPSTSPSAILPRISTAKPSAKVKVKAKGPKVNATVKTSKSEQKNKIVKTTTINIESYTNLFVTDMPSTGRLTKRPQSVVIDEDTSETMWVKIRDGRPVTAHRKAITTQRPTSTRRATTRRITRRPSTCPPTSTRRVTPSMRRRTPPRTRGPNYTSPKPTTRPSKITTPHRPPAPVIPTTDSPDIQLKPNNKQWISSMFLDNKKAKRKTISNKNKTQTSWFSGLLSNIFKWVKKSSRVVSSWISNSSWFQESEKVPDTTTPPPTTTTSGDWFENILALEDDGAYVINDNKRKPKKSIKKTYRGYQLLRTYPDIQWKVHELMDLQEETQGSGLMWWTQPSINGSTDLLVPPDLLPDVKDHFKTMQIDFDVVIWDLQKAILYENPKMSKKQRIELEQIRGHPMTWRRYHRYADILRYMEYLQHSNTDIVELLPLGRSSEGLPLVAVKVSLPTNDTYSKLKSNQKKKWKLKSKMKPAVWIDGGTHAREWITPAVATWILHTLVEGERGLGSEEEVLRQADFYIMPVVNPDGYEHSHTHDRLWRKTRSRHSDDDYYYNSWFPWNWGNTDCVGVDADRNWDHHWGEKDSSKDPCADTYAGPHPFSEPETRAVSNFLAENRDRIKVYLSLHAYSQSWLMPSSHAHAQFADDGILMEMGKLATASLSDLYGTKFKVGTISELGQPASGMAHDWAKARAGVKFSYHVDLRDSFGPYGFLLPGSQIVSTARETWQAVKTIVDNLSGE